MKARTITLLCSVVLLASCVAHRNNYSHSILNKRQVREVDKTIATIAEKNTLPQMDVWGSTYDVNESQLLNRLLAIEDLDSLARNHPSPAVRATAGIILIERAPQAAKRLLSERITDTSTLTTQSYGFCIVTRSGNTVGNILLSYAIEHNLFSHKEQAALDSIILSTPACRHLNRYHYLTKTPIPRKAFQDMMYGHPHRSAKFSHDLLTDNRLLADTAFYLNYIKQTLHLEGNPRCYILDAVMRPSWNGYTIAQLYIADGHPDRLALLFIDGKYDIVDTMSIIEPIRTVPLNETDTMYTHTRFVMTSNPARHTHKLVLRNTGNGMTDTLENVEINRGYTLDQEHGFVPSRRQQTVDNLKGTNSILEEPIY